MTAAAILISVAFLIAVAMLARYVWRHRAIRTKYTGQRNKWADHNRNP